LSGVQLSEDIADSPHADLARLTGLRNQLLPSVDILPRHSVSAGVSQSANGEFDIAVSTSIPGEYMVRIVTTGQHPNGGEFMRTRLICISAR